MPETITCRAGVVWKSDEPVVIEKITVDPPEAGEVRIKMLFTSVCHTDEYTRSGCDREAKFPCVLGHEGAGIVESVGEGVTSVVPGDHVIPLYIPQCRDCKFCKHPRTNLCSKIRETQGKGFMPDGTSRFKLNGSELYHYMGCSTFSEYTVVAEISLAKVPKDVPLDRVCLLGCGVSTGYGAALNTANVQKGDTVAIWGLGAVGLAVADGCRQRGASRIIGVDTNEEKFKIASKFGVTECFNPDTLSKPHSGNATDLERRLPEPHEKLIEMTDGGLDFTFECIGNVDCMREALQACHKGWGKSIVIGVAKSRQEIRTSPFQLVTGRTWTGCAFGGWKSRDDLPKLVEFYQSGTLDLDKYITHRKQGIESLDDVFKLLRSGESLRCVVTFEEPQKI